eukprot:7329017-Pyramimonas_sp.AAC.1
MVISQTNSCVPMKIRAAAVWHARNARVHCANSRRCSAGEIFEDTSWPSNSSIREFMRKAKCSCS